MTAIFLLLAQVPLGLDAFIPTPEGNPLTPEKIALGKRLFTDKRLSRDQSVSCATCHDPARAFTDGNPQAVGIRKQRGERRVPALINRAYGKSFFWDGRVATLEEQVLKPIESPIEMDLPPEEAARRVNLTTRQLSHALASYVRTILSGDSPYDRYVAGNRDALSEAAKLGLRVFRGKGNCVACHVGPNLTDEKFHNTGAGKPVDVGRYAITKLRADIGAFKTPTLRDAARRPPYMHAGGLATLDEVVDFYDKGGGQNPNLDAEIRRLNLTAAEKRALVKLLESLTGQTH